MSKVTSVFPFLGWFKNYSIRSLRSDFIAGLTVALVLVPQSMAYAQLAGLPAYFGLYAAFLPPLVAAMFGSSRQLATGPVAVVSLMTAASLEPLATAGSEAFIAYAILLALLVGAFQFLLGVLRLGLVVNFLSHPVVNGFTNAAAIIIASSQLSKLFGVHVASSEHHYETVYRVIKAALAYTHWPTVALAILAFAIMIGFKRLQPRIPYVLAAVMVTTIVSWAVGFQHDHKADISSIEAPKVTQKIRMYNSVLEVLARKSGGNVLLGSEIQETESVSGSESADAVALRGQKSLLNVGITNLKGVAGDCQRELRSYLFRAEVSADGEHRFYLADQFPEDRVHDGRIWRLQIGNAPLKTDALTFLGGGAVVGHIPAGLPQLSIPSIELSTITTLLPMAIVISLLGFMEAISIAKAMATRTGQRLNANQELIGQGLANIVGSVGQSYAVSGSFSRSAVNLQAGAVSGLSSVFSSAFVVITLLFFTPLLYHLPQAVLAAIIMMAVFGLIRVRGFVHASKAQWYDGAISIVTFITTLAFAPHLDRGIFVGVVLSIGLHLFRDMKPKINLLAKHFDGTYRSREKFNLAQCRHIAVIRYQGSLIFANVNFLEEQVLERVSTMPHLKHVLIVGNGINELDASGEEMLSVMVKQLRGAGYDISFSGLNESVMDVMRRTGLYGRIGEDHLYRNATRAIKGIWSKAHKNSGEKWCPLINTSVEQAG